MVIASEFSLLNQTILDCTRCRLSKTRIQPVPGEGNIRSGVLMIAQAPGKTEDRTGQMFMGPSGKLFYELLTKAKIDTESFYMTNLIKCLLPKSRRPSRDEITACTCFLEKEINFVKPRLIVPLGFHATRYLLKRFDLEQPASKDYNILFGKLTELEDCSIFPLRHPTALFFNPEKREIMEANYTKAGSHIEKVAKHPG